MSEQEQDRFTEEEMAEMRKLIRMSQSARLLWGMVVGLVGLLSGCYAVYDHFNPSK